MKRDRQTEGQAYVRKEKTDGKNEGTKAGRNEGREVKEREAEDRRKRGRGGGAEE